MQDRTDWELVDFAKAGDQTAYAELVRRYHGPVIGFCKRMVGSAEDAEDLAQEAFVRVHRHLKRLKPKAKFSTFLFGVARNLAINHLRDSTRRGRGQTDAIGERPISGGEGDQPDRQARAHEAERMLEAGLAALSAEHREVLVLRELQGMDYDAIAAVIGCRKGTVKSRLARAREQLRLRLLELGGDLL